MKIIMKFGGTSLADGKKLSHVSNLITDHYKKNDLIIVNSALHDITDQLSEISNNIIDYDPESAGAVAYSQLAEEFLKLSNRDHSL